MVKRSVFDKDYLLMLLLSPNLCRFRVQTFCLSTIIIIVDIGDLALASLWRGRLCFEWNPLGSWQVRTSSDDDTDLMEGCFEMVLKLFTPGPWTGGPFIYHLAQFPFPFVKANQSNPHQNLFSALIATRTTTMTVSTQLWWDALSSLLMQNVTYLHMWLLCANVLLQTVFFHKHKLEENTVLKIRRLENPWYISRVFV